MDDPGWSALMGTRSTARFVHWKVESHPDGGVKVAARCLSGDCPWLIVPTPEQERVSQAMRHHTATTGHALFWRTFEELAVVVLADEAERKRRAEANRLEYTHLGGAAEDASEARSHPADCPAP